MALFGEYLKHYRSEKGLSLRRLSEMIDVDPSVLSRVERGEVANPSDDLLERLPSALQRAKSEVYLVAGRITPELLTAMEKGMPQLPEKTAKLLGALENELLPLVEAPPVARLMEMASPADLATMSQIEAAINDIAALAGALETGAISHEQFGHICELIKQLRLSFLP